jgi:DNA-binding NarL/FixJ family response regulator
MPVMGGQVALRKLLALSPPPKVVIVTVFADKSHVRELMSLGASAYLSKNASMQNLISTVRSVTARNPEGPDEDDVILFVPRGAFEEGGGPGRARSPAGSWRYCCWLPVPSPTAR